MHCCIPVLHSTYYLIRHIYITSPPCSTVCACCCCCSSGRSSAVISGPTWSCWSCCCYRPPHIISLYHLVIIPRFGSPAVLLSLGAIVAKTPYILRIRHLTDYYNKLLLEVDVLLHTLLDVLPHTSYKCHLTTLKYYDGLVLLL